MSYSVLMSVYYKEKAAYFKQAVESILVQTVPTDDFVVVCDGPLTNELNQTLAEYREKYPDIFRIICNERNLGLGTSLNIGMEHCKNELIARMDSDDISLPDRCEKQLKVFEEHPEIDIVSGTILEFSDDPNRILAIKKLPLLHNDIYKYGQVRCPFNHPCVMFKKSVVKSAGGYKAFYLFEDYFLWVRMLLYGAKARNCSEPLLKMRANSSMYSRRGGLKYANTMLGFRWWMVSVGYTSIWKFMYSALPQWFICVMPNTVREIIYKKFLRG